MKPYTRQMIVPYFKPGTEVIGSHPMFSYLLLAEPPVDDRFLIWLVNLKDEDQPNALNGAGRIFAAAGSWDRIQ